MPTPAQYGYLGDVGKRLRAGLASYYQSRAALQIPQDPFSSGKHSVDAAYEDTDPEQAYQ
ncbi:hypothetical protein AC579_31 [Pseudocercospora musae]|uniref:Uncharacterized protein n=1 Tax=Pseudocercospora musae TaxID=113226 RepID=A0A139GWN0_9PEZI|nr:hypothetical protein AC579_31 [Pseudocercospora musae]